ncbi:MAG: response regulator transcription factor [Actinomycetota bacterium]|nr:response regulator transcription factor [Actinomycetota bacterium]
MAGGRVVICDDHEIVREALKSRISDTPNLELIGEAADGEAAVALVNDLQPDLLIIDVEMPRLDGISALETVHKTHPEVKVLMFTAHEQRNVIGLAARAGASGYLLKSSSAAEIQTAAETVLGGDRYFPAGFEPPAADEHDELERLRLLSPRERQVLDLLATGMRARGVADEIGIQPATVYTHVRNVVLKLDVETQTQAVAIATKYSFLTAEDPASPAA